ncbi:MAG: response regulator transcription factor [Planctomycetota bacterium]
MRIVIIDDHPLIRRGFQAAIGEREDYEIVSMVGTVAEGREAIDQHRPEMAVVDLGLPDGSGIELISHVKHHSPQTKVLVSSMRDERIFATRCIKEGASGFIPKQDSDTELMEAIDQIADGGIYLSDRVEHAKDDEIADAFPEPFAALRSLSARELLVFELIGSGISTSNIAERLNIRPKTVDSYRERIKGKLHLENMTELLRHATRWTILLEQGE